MELYKSLALYLVSFSLGMLFNLGLYYLIVHRPGKRNKSNRVSAAYAYPGHRGCINCKHLAESVKAEPCYSCDIINGNPDKWEATP